MIIASALLFVIGIFLLTCGILIWKKEMIVFLHSYHRNKVSEEDKSAFCKISGIGIILIGLGILISGIIVFITNSPFSFIAVAVGFIAGLAMLVSAGLKYNQ